MCGMHLLTSDAKIGQWPMRALYVIHRCRQSPLQPPGGLGAWAVLESVLAFFLARLILKSIVLHWALTGFGRFMQEGDSITSGERALVDIHYAPDL
jgi:hypothetical protein